MLHRLEGHKSTRESEFCFVYTRCYTRNNSAELACRFFANRRDLSTKDNAGMANNPERNL